MTTVFVASTGPPPVSSQIISNRRNDQIAISKPTIRSVGIKKGRTTDLKVLNMSAPSTRVASYSSSGTDCNAARTTSITKGETFQMVAISTETMPYLGSVSHPTEPIPSAPSAWLAIPVESLKIHRNTNTTATVGTAHGITITARASTRPGNARLSTTADTMPSSREPITVKKV